MKILAFDSTNTGLSVSIAQDNKITSYQEVLTPSVQAERIVDMIEKALYDSNMQYKDIDYLAVTNGPGSFTAIRIGLAVATGITIGLKNIQTIVLTNFEVYHFRAKGQVNYYDQIIIILNAFRHQCYVQIFDKNDNPSQPLLIDYNEVVKLIKEQNGISVCLGNGITFIYEEIKLLDNVQILPRFSRIRASFMCNYVTANLSNLPKRKIQPLYIRLPDAKIK